MVNDFGNYLKSMRKDKTLTEISKKSHLSISYLSKLERNNRNIPSAKALKSLSECYDIPYPDIMQAAGYWSADEIKDMSENSKSNNLIEALGSEGMYDFSDKEIDYIVKYAKFIKHELNK